jgi:hypothetical protein
MDQVTLVAHCHMIDPSQSLSHRRSGLVVPIAPAEHRRSMKMHLAVLQVLAVDPRNLVVYRKRQPPIVVQDLTLGFPKNSTLVAVKPRFACPKRAAAQGWEYSAFPKGWLAAVVLEIALPMGWLAVEKNLALPNFQVAGSVQAASPNFPAVAFGPAAPSWHQAYHPVDSMRQVRSVVFDAANRWYRYR